MREVAYSFVKYTCFRQRQTCARYVTACSVRHAVLLCLHADQFEARQA